MSQWLTAISAINMLSRAISSISSRRAVNHQKATGGAFSSRLKEEIEAKVSLAREVKKVMELYDSNNDGKISLQESGMEPREFARWDLNGDGYVTENEINILWSNLGPFDRKVNRM